MANLLDMPIKREVCVVLSRKEAVDMIAYLSAQLGNVPLARFEATGTVASVLTLNEKYQEGRMFFMIE